MAKKAKVDASSTNTATAADRQASRQDAAATRRDAAEYRNTHDKRPPAWWAIFDREYNRLLTDPENRGEAAVLAEFAAREADAAFAALRDVL